MNDTAKEHAPDPESMSPQDAAFLESEANEFLGEPLQAFSAMRRNAAQALGNRLFCGTAQVEGDDAGLYPGAMADAVIVLYLCSCPKIEVLRALRKPEEIHAKAMDWADEREIAVGTAAGAEALEVYGGILQQISGSQFEVERDPKPQGAAGSAPGAEASPSLP